MTFVLANIFQPLIDVFDHVIVFFHDSIGLSWGMSIIALTVVVRTVLLPLTIKQFKSMARLQMLAPEMKALQEKYKDDKQRLQQETMKFYRENQVNPLGSCLPLVLQIPVFIALFYMLREDLKIDICGPASKIAAVGKEQGTDLAHTYCNEVVEGSAKFGFIPDLTAPATGGVLAVLLVLYVASQLVSSVLMSVTTDKTQRTIMIALPFVFVFFVRTFPAGLLVYWITTNIWTIGQQLFVRKALDQPMPWVVRKEAKEAKAEGRPVPSPFARRGEPAKAVVPATPPPPSPAPQEEEDREAPVSAREDMQELLELIVEAIGIEGSVVMEDDGETLTGTIEGESLGLLIGHHGQTIDAIQHLAARVVLRDGGDSDRRRIVVDADGYRARRREALEHQADDAADEAVRTGQEVELDPMSPSERRIVHEHLRDRDDVETQSEGEGPERRLVVMPVE